MIKYAITDSNGKVIEIECLFKNQCKILGLNCELCNALKAFKSNVELEDFKNVKLYRK